MFTISRMLSIISEIHRELYLNNFLEITLLFSAPIRRKGSVDNH